MSRTSYCRVVRACYGCGVRFVHNPYSGPTVQPGGEKGRVEPVCRACVDRVNYRREANGLPLVPIKRGAYEST